MRKIRSADIPEEAARSFSSSNFAGVEGPGGVGEGVGDGAGAGGDPGEEIEVLLFGGEPFAVGGIGEDFAGLGQPLAFLDQHGEGGLVALPLFEGGIQHLRPLDDDRGREGLFAEQRIL